jgi:hypothetical protein
LLILAINNKNKPFTRVFLFIGFIVSFSGVALYQLPYALDNVNAYPTDPVQPGASGFSPGHQAKLIPSDPVQPGASGFSPGHQSQSPGPT